MDFWQKSQLLPHVFNKLLYKKISMNPTCAANIEDRSFVIGEVDINGRKELMELFQLLQFGHSSVMAAMVIRFCEVKGPWSGPPIEQS